MLQPEALARQSDEPSIKAWLRRTKWQTYRRCSEIYWTNRICEYDNGSAHGWKSQRVIKKGKTRIVGFRCTHLGDPEDDSSNVLCPLRSDLEFMNQCMDFCLQEFFGHGPQFGEFCQSFLALDSVVDDAEFMAHDSSTDPAFDLDSVRHAINNMAKGKVADQYGMRMEIMQHLFSDAASASLVTHHLQHHAMPSTPHPHGWSSLKMHLIPKVRSIKIPNRLRFVVFASISEILYRRAPLQTFQDQFQFSVFQTARGRYQCGDASFLVNSLTMFARETDTRVWFVETDISAAFDRLAPEAIIRSSFNQKIDCLLVHAICKACLSSLVVIQHRNVDCLARIFGGIRQGMGDSPIIHSVAQDYLLAAH